MCGREYLRLPAFAADQQFQRFAHGGVVVDNDTIGVPCDMGDDLNSWPSARAKFIEVFGGYGSLFSQCNLRKSVDSYRAMLAHLYSVILVAR